MDPTCAALIAGAKDDPDGPARLVLADWLTENDQEPRAELIRVQYRLGELDECDPERAALFERERELIAAHGQGWLGRFELVPWNGSFRRGLLHLTCSHPGECGNAAWADDLTARGAWLESVELRSNGDGEELRALLSHHTIARATAWCFSDPELRPEHFRHLADANFPCGVVSLDLRGRELSVPGLLYLAGASWFAGLRHLSAGAGAPIDAEHIGVLLGSAAGRLRSLDLNSRDLDPYAAAALARAPAAVGLERLLVYNNLLGAGGARRLAAGDWTALRRLNLSVNGIGDAGLDALLAAPWRTGLTHLDLNASSITASGARALAECSGLSGLAHLALSGNLIGAEGALELARATDLAGLSSLLLDRNDLGDTGAKALADWPGLAGLRVLYLRGNGIGPRGALALAESAALDDVTHLDLSKNPLGTRAKALLAERFGSRVAL